MTETAIEINNLSKRYRIGELDEKHDTLGSLLISWIKTPLTNFKKVKSLSYFDNNSKNIIWALKDISLEIERGTILGVVGKNGAGKSTLLKILAQITNPTSGECSINGRVASLLEVGTGFHPELTGRENVFLNGTLLGMTKNEIDSKFKEIVDFSGIEKYIDTPVKRYSSGMRVRLAFSVAAHLDPEILLIDEVLAVGDSEFQNKCIGKMSEISSQDRTIIFVSHNLSAVRSLCSKALLLSEGKLLNYGNTDTILKEYLSSDNAGNKTFKKAEYRYDDKLVPNGKVILHSIKIFDENDDMKNSFENSEIINVQLEFTILEKIDNIVIGIDIERSFNELVFRTFHNDDTEILDKNILNKKQSLVLTIPSYILNGGSYYIYPCIGDHRREWIIGGAKDVEGISINIHFNVPNNQLVYNDNKPGAISPILKWKNKVL